MKTSLRVTKIESTDEAFVITYDFLDNGQTPDGNDSQSVIETQTIDLPRSLSKEEIQTQLREILVAFNADREVNESSEVTNAETIAAIENLEITTADTEETIEASAEPTTTEQATTTPQDATEQTQA